MRHNLRTQLRGTNNAPSLWGTINALINVFLSENESHADRTATLSRHRRAISSAHDRQENDDHPKYIHLHIIPSSSAIRHVRDHVTSTAPENQRTLSEQH